MGFLQQLWLQFRVPGLTEALRSESSRLGWIHQPGGQQWERNAVFSLLLTGLWRLRLPSSTGSGLGKLGIRGLIPPRILFFLASCGLLFRKGPSSNQPESTASFIWTRDAMKRETAVFLYHISGRPSRMASGGRCCRLQSGRGSFRAQS